MLNRNNGRYWVKDRLGKLARLLTQEWFEERLGFNVWIRVLITEIFGPICFDGPLTSQRYSNRLKNSIDEYL